MSRKITVHDAVCVLLLGAWLCTPVAMAQPAGAVVATSTTSENLPRLEYLSPISAYKTYQPQEIQPWKESNDTVGHIGGWRAYSREKAQPQIQPAPLAASNDGTAHSTHHQEKK